MRKPVLENNESDELIGLGGLTPWKLDGENLIDITYRLRESAWKKGYGKELAIALVRHGFLVLGLKEITATVTPENFPSKKLLLKLGFRFDRNIVLLGVPTELYRLARTESRHLEEESGPQAPKSV